MSYSWPPSVTEAKAQLGKTDSVDDVELAGFIDGVVAVVEYLCGPISSTTVTEWRDGGGQSISPRKLPVLSVTSVTEYTGTSGTVLSIVADPSVSTSYSVTVDPQTGTITRRVGGGYAYIFAPGDKNVKLVYQAGFASAPANVRWAALELIRVNWVETQNAGRGARNSHLNVNEGEYVLGYFIPNKVREMLAPNERLPGIA